MGKSAVVWSCLILIVALLGKNLLELGVFRHIEMKGLDKCRLIIPAYGENQAFEDLIIDYEKGVAYMAGDDRVWWDSFVLPDQNSKKQGTVFHFDIQSEIFQKFHLIGYPYEHFHPLGLGLLKRENNQLFMTNFRTNKEEILPTVEIFEIDSSNANQLRWIDSVVHPLLIVPDDVLPIDEKTFYVTNLNHYRKDRSPFMNTFETLAQRAWMDVVLCSKTTEWQCSIVADSIAVANGITSSLDFQTIYVGGSVEKSIRIYERHPDDNSLTYKKSLYVPFLTDNLSVDDKDQLIVAGHPKILDFLRHQKYPRKYRAPSEVVMFSHPTTNSTYQTLFRSNGEILSASTVASPYQNKLLIGAVFDQGILLCEDLF